uniref:Flagellar hook-length control protein-like C-terminal domain-containing protein n=1 Tax=Rhodopseudomonas palustris (strain BisA53) TaxID=316055 RepID=Q07KR0_RHOP5
MSIAVNTTLPIVAAQTTGAITALQPGTVITARVLQVLDKGQVQIAIGNDTLAVRSEVPLQAGQTLKLAVSQTADGFRLAVLPQQTAATSTTLSNAATLGTSATLPQAVATLAADSAVSLASQLPLPSVAQSSALTSQETLAVSTAAQLAATKQNSLSPLFANLDAVDLSALPPKLQAAVAQVLAQRTSLDSTLTGATLKQAVQSSGLFLEASLASNATAKTSAGTPDLKAALIVLRQALTATLGATTTPQTTALTAQLNAGTLTAGATLATAPPLAGSFTTVLSPTLAPPTTTTTSPTTPATTTSQPIIAIVDETANQLLARQAATSANRAASGATLAALQETLQSNPLLAGQSARLLPGNAAMLSLVPLLSGAKPPLKSNDASPQATTSPPPIRGALPAVQPVAAATLVQHAPLEETTRKLLAETDAALARQTLLQVASLPDRTDAAAPRLDNTTARWAFEIPFLTPQGTAMAQFEISRESAANESEAAQRIWRAKFSLDVEPAGPVHAVVSLVGDKTSVKMWAERPATAAQLRAGAGQLIQALSRADLQPGEIVVRDGAPREAAAPSAGYFLDRAL